MSPASILTPENFKEIIDAESLMNSRKFSRDKINSSVSFENIIRQTCQNIYRKS